MFEKLPLPNSITGKNYVAIEKIGEGSTGAVYRGYNINDTEQQHPLAIRFPTIIDTPKKRKDLIKKQAEVLQELASPHTIKYLDHCEHSINPYLVMGYVPETITYRIEKNTLTQKLFLQYLAQIPIILDFLRNKNKVHGDLKCGNLGIDQNKIIMLDFESTNEPGKYKLPP